MRFRLLMVILLAMTGMAAAQVVVIGGGYATLMAPGATGPTVPAPWLSVPQIAFAPQLQVGASNGTAGNSAGASNATGANIAGASNSTTSDTAVAKGFGFLQQYSALVQSAALQALSSADNVAETQTQPSSSEQSATPLFQTGAAQSYSAYSVVTNRVDIAAFARQLRQEGGPAGPSRTYTNEDIDKLR